MQLTKNFSLIEFTSSETAMRRRIDNNPGKAEIDNLKALCEMVLQPLRDIYGKPINITSGYRSPRLNTAIGGSRNSQHCFGQAVDFQVPRTDYLRVFEILKTLPHDQIIWEFGDSVAPLWIHLSYTRTPRFQILRAYKNMLGQTKYETKK
jgi:hypothetical protein